MAVAELHHHRHHHQQEVDTWTRSADFRLAEQIAQLHEHHRDLADRGRRALARRTLGGDQRILARMKRVAGLYAELRAIELEILALELL